jgi:hypothetical protein
LLEKEEDASDGERLQLGRGQRLHGGPTSGPHMSTSVKDESKRGILFIQKFKVVSVYAHGSKYMVGVQSGVFQNLEKL